MFFEDNKYVIIKNLFPKSLCNIIKQYAIHDYINHIELEDLHGVKNAAHSKYADCLMESLLCNIQPAIEKYTNKKLIPTYSFYRIYKDGAILNDHLDRPACEISVSIPIGYDYSNENYKWNLHGYVNDEKIYFECDPGDAVIYKGCELKHGRDRFEGGEGAHHCQLFLHYVDADGPYAEEHKFDGRVNIGIKKETKTSPTVEN